MTGIITDIHRTSTVDGPGIRTTAFLKGCPLSCVWCHNPETQSVALEAGYGRAITADAVVAECLRDRVYYEESGGGVTLSGGEPLRQHAFAFDILRQLKAAGVHTALDTTGCAAPAVIAESLPLTDLYLFDYKATDPVRHQELVGCSLGPLLRNLELLMRNDAKVILRCPMIPGVNDNDAHLAAIAEMETSYPALQGIDILPWHTMGKAKFEKLGRPLDPRLPGQNASPSDLERYRDFFDSAGCALVRIKG